MTNGVWCMTNSGGHLTHYNHNQRGGSTIDLIVMDLPAVQLFHAKCFFTYDLWFMT